MDGDDFVALAAQNGGWERRFARRFIACYTVGLLAIKFDILPWSEELVKEAVVACYRDVPAGDTERRHRAEARAGAAS